MNIEPARLSVADMERALSVLPELQRRVFLLTARDRVPYSEVAEQLGISVARLERLLAKRSSQSIVGCHDRHDGPQPLAASA